MALWEKLGGSGPLPRSRWWKGAIILRVGVHPSTPAGVGSPRSPEIDVISLSRPEHLPGSSRGLPPLPAQAGGEVLGEGYGCSQPVGEPPPPTP